MKLSKQDWKRKQADSDIGPIITLIKLQNTFAICCKGRGSIWNESFVEVLERSDDERRITL